MAKSKLEKITSIEEEIRQLNAKKSKLKQEHNAQERKARNHRLCQRGGLVEKLLPELIALTDEQFETFVGKTLLADHTKRILTEIVAQTPTNPTHPQGGTGTAQGGDTATARPAEATQHHNTGGSGNEGNDTGRGG